MKPARIPNSEYCSLYRQKIGPIRLWTFQGWFENRFHMTIHLPVSNATSPLSLWERARVRAITMFAAGVENLEGLKAAKLAGT